MKLISARTSRASANSYRLRRALGHRFLCPDCLHFGEPRYACGACGDEIEPFVVQTTKRAVNRAWDVAGFRAAMASLAKGRLTIAASCVGLAERIIAAFTADLTDRD